MDVPSVLNEMEDDRREYRDDLLHGTLTLVSAMIADGYEPTDKQIEKAVTLTHNVIRKVDRWCDAINRTPPVPPVVLSTAKSERCHSHKDGDCTWPACPQLRDNEPAATGRHCPLDDGEDGYE